MVQTNVFRVAAFLCACVAVESMYPYYPGELGTNIEFSSFLHRRQNIIWQQKAIKV